MSKIRLNTPLTRLTKKQITQFSEAVFRWVKKNSTNYPKRIYIKVSSYQMKTGITLGEYEFTQQRITVYYKDIRNIKELITTILHEFRHSKQSYQKYVELAKTYSYRNHPYELQANKFSKKQLNKCWRSLQHLDWL